MLSTRNAKKKAIKNMNAPAALSPSAAEVETVDPKESSARGGSVDPEDPAAMVPEAVDPSSLKNKHLAFFFNNTSSTSSLKEQSESSDVVQIHQLAACTIEEDSEKIEVHGLWGDDP